MGEETVAGIHRQAADLLRRSGRHLLDVHSAGRAHHENRALRLAVQDQPHVALAGDLGRGHHQDLPNRQPLDGEGQDPGGVLSSLRGSRGQLYPAGFPAPAGVHLRLYHHRAAQASGDGFGLLRAARHVALQHGDAGRPQERAGLVLVEVHWYLGLGVTGRSGKPGGAQK